MSGTGYTIELSEAEQQSARDLRAAGVPWDEIGHKLGYSRHVIQNHLDPVYAERVRQRYRHRDRVHEKERRRGQPTHQVEAGHRPADVVARMLATVPRDTRGRTARLMGDPLPGRSALDMLRRNGASSVVPTFNTYPRSPA